MNNILSPIDWSLIITNSVSGIITSVISTAITATVGYFIVKKYASHILFSKKMKEQGFVNTSTNKQSFLEIKRMCEEATEIKIIYVSGIRWLQQNMKYLKSALQRGTKIKLLCCNPDSRFLKDIENMEINWSNSIRQEGDNSISSEIITVINRFKTYGIDIKLYSTEYRLPYILAYYKDGSVRAWLTMTLPPYKSVKSFVLRGEKKSDHFYSDDVNFVDMMEANFDTIWNYSSISINDMYENKEKVLSYEKLYSKWQSFYEVAKANMEKNKNKKGMLIEVAAQHPLIDGVTPNEEYEKRLLFAVKLFNEEKAKSKKVYLYCPGSIHKDNGISDKISLSEAGKNFLVNHGIPEEFIYSEEMNSKYKGEKGVYNSSDECYVACKIFEEKNYKELHCICSSAQMMRKVLSYIRFGYVPNIHTVSCDNMYHNYIYEIFRNIPSLINDNNALQGDSELAKLIRKERDPNIK